MSQGHRSGFQRDRRGMAAIVMIIVLVLISLVVIGMVVGGGRDQVVVARRLESIQAFYAAEAGMNMAVREMQEGTDEDGDGTEGTISDDGNSANDPTLGTGRVFVTISTSGSTDTLISTGRSGSAVRVIEVDLE